MFVKERISFEAAEAEDYSAFKRIRIAGMKPYALAQGFLWDEDIEEDYHQELFATPGLRRILYDKQPYGFIGIHEDEGRLTLSRFCLDPGLPHKGLGTCVLEKILSEPVVKDRDFFLDILISNPARRLYERFGFKRIAEDDKFYYYKRDADAPPPCYTAQQNQTPQP